MRARGENKAEREEEQTSPTNREIDGVRSAHVTAAGAGTRARACENRSVPRAFVGAFFGLIVSCKLNEASIIYLFIFFFILFYYALCSILFIFFSYAAGNERGFNYI